MIRGVRAFFDRQVHIAMEHYGRLDPLDLDEYLAHDGFAALARCLGVASAQTRAASKPLPPAPRRLAPTLSPEQIITTIEHSGLRGRGGAGFPTGQKWRMVRQQPGETKYVICNGDEGDPGAFMDRMILESFPYRVIEGLAIAAVAVGAHEAIFYIRHEYPLAVRRVRAALAECERRGWLGERLLGSDYPLRISIKEGAGAFVCGEETALIASVEGRRGMPRLRPPFPAQSGLWGKPTLINNVETLAMVPWIIRHGAEAFAGIGTADQQGHQGLLRWPARSAAAADRNAHGHHPPPDRRGDRRRRRRGAHVQGGADRRALRRLRAGAPGRHAGGLRIPARHRRDHGLRRPGGARRHRLHGGHRPLFPAVHAEPVVRQMHLLPHRHQADARNPRPPLRRQGHPQAPAGTGTTRAARSPQGSLCGLGKTAPNPVLTTLRYFRDEYEAHLQGRCPAGKCKALIKYRVRENCTGCTLCAQHCPVDAIPMTPYARHVIDLEKCTRCDSCRQVCPYEAVEVI